MRILTPSDAELLAGVSNGRHFASLQDPDVPKDITLVVANPNALVTQSWFMGFLERYFELGINVNLELAGPSEPNTTEFYAAVKRLIRGGKLKRQEVVLNEIRLKLRREFGGSTDFVELVKDAEDNEFFLADFFEAKSSEDGGVELENVVDHYFKRTLNRDQLAAVIVSLIDLSLGG